MSSAEPVRTRRTTEEVRRLILEAARELFLTNGYETTTTKEICVRAAVSEPLIFSHFGNKAGLFDAAVLAPFAKFVADYAATSQRAGDVDPKARADNFANGLFDLARSNRTVLLSAVMQRVNGGDRPEDDVLDHVASTLQGLDGVTNLREYDDVDPPAALAAAAGMVLGVALLDDLLFPSGTRRPSRARLIDEMAKMVLYGTTRRSDSGETNRQARS